MDDAVLFHIEEEKEYWVGAIVFKLESVKVIIVYIIIIKIRL